MTAPAPPLLDRIGQPWLPRVGVPTPVAGVTSGPSRNRILFAPPNVLISPTAGWVNVGSALDVAGWARGGFEFHIYGPNFGSAASCRVLTPSGGVVIPSTALVLGAPVTVGLPILTDRVQVQIENQGVTTLLAFFKVYLTRE